MESLIKKDNSLISSRIPKNFIDKLDKWREKQKNENNTIMSRNMSFNLFSQILDDVNIKSEKKKGKKRYIIDVIGGYFK